MDTDSGRQYSTSVDLRFLICKMGEIRCPPGKGVVGSDRTRKRSGTQRVRSLCLLFLPTTLPRLYPESILPPEAIPPPFRDEGWALRVLRRLRQTHQVTLTATHRGEELLHAAGAQKGT